jgi:hypothetical protein
MQRDEGNANPNNFLATVGDAFAPSRLKYREIYGLTGLGRA